MTQHASRKFKENLYEALLSFEDEILTLILDFVKSRISHSLNILYQPSIKYNNNNVLFSHKFYNY